nr:unnamed protein product [Callosobruchus analis]
MEQDCLRKIEHKLKKQVKPQAHHRTRHRTYIGNKDSTWIVDLTLTLAGVLSTHDDVTPDTCLTPSLTLVTLGLPVLGIFVIAAE